MSEATAATVETQRDIGPSPKDLVRRWLLELKLANKGEEKWRKNAARIYGKYRGEDRRKNSFNILWANTELLRPAIYNSTPKPDVRRRYRDADPIGKAVSETLSRGLEFSVSTYDFDAPIKLDVLDYLVTGRGISRIRYEPSLTKTEGEGEQLDWEKVCCEHVNWQDFRRGQGRTWDEVMWVGFRHQLTRQQCIEQFGEEIGNAINLQDGGDDDLRSMSDDDPVKQLFATGEVWEIWDKENRRVLFISNGYPNGPLKVEPDPLGLQDFFPNPRPLLSLEDSDKLEPTPLYSQYEEQAAELDLVTKRINKLVDACKMRGIYDSTVSEISQVMKGEDNDLLPAKNVTAFLDKGGIEKMIWFMPVEQIAKVLAGLYLQRDQVISVIYQLTGISDIARGDSDPRETASAQRLKSQWGSLRLQKMQREVQRYCRDLIRMMGEVIAGKFSVETLQGMTQLPYLTAEQEQAAQAQYAIQAQQAQQAGQVPPPPQLPPTWDQVMQMLRSDAMRTYHVDIETDSTVADQLSGDMAGLQEVLTAVAAAATAFGPMVMAGALPADAMKEILLTITRRARMGNAVEDAIEKMQQPRPQQEGGQDTGPMANAQVQKAQMDNETKRLEIQSDSQQIDKKLQVELQKEKMKIDSNERIKLAEIQGRQREQALGAMQQPAVDPNGIKQMIEQALAPLMAQMQNRPSRRIRIMQNDNEPGVMLIHTDSGETVQ